jgi:sulfur-carrier protein
MREGCERPVIKSSHTLRAGVIAAAPWRARDQRCRDRLEPAVPRDYAAAPLLRIRLAVTSATDAIVRIPMPLRPSAGGASELRLAAAPPPSVRAVLADLAARHPALHRSICDETGAVRRHVNLWVNSRHLRDLAGLDTLLQPGDVLSILPAVSGG